MEETKLNDLIARHSGIMLDIGCGENKQENYVGMDIRNLPGVDIVHNIEIIPWPLPDECVIRAVMFHLFEHINPAKTLQIMDELWRVMKPGGEVFIETPYGVSFEYIMDPTHCNPSNEITWQYFDPRCALWKTYRPKPWLINAGFPTWQVQGNMQVALTKIEKKAKSEK